MAEEIPDKPEGFDVTAEFGMMSAKREKDSQALANSFGEGGVWLARQNDPLEQMKKIMAGAYLITHEQKAEANRQLDEIVNTGSTSAGRFFDIIEGLYIYRIDPSKFYDMVMAHNEHRKAEEALKRNPRGKSAEWEKFAKFDFKKLIKEEPKDKNETNESPRPKMSDEEFRRIAEELLKSMENKKKNRPDQTNPPESTSV